MNIYLKSVLLYLVLFCLISCEDPSGDLSQTQFGIFEVLDENTVEMNGEINSTTLDDFNDLIDQYPNVDRIEMNEVPGSVDDEINLLVSAQVHQQNIEIHLLDDGIIASGGVDFFLAGVKRSKGSNTMIGVHSWSDGVNEATDFPEGHAMHQPYINYYTSIGFSQQEAEDFYYFTINAAPAASIHYMTDDEIEQFNILKP